MDKSGLNRNKLIDRLIINYTTTENVGKLANILLDLEKHQVKGIISKSGLLGREKCYFLWEQIESIGKDSILVSYDSEVEMKSSELKNTLVGAQLWNDSGNKVGVITDYLFDQESGKIISYLFTSNGWRGITDGVYFLAPENVITLADKRLIAKNESVENAEKYSDGIASTMGKVTDFIKEDYEQTMEDLHLGKKESKAQSEEKEVEEQGT